MKSIKVIIKDKNTLVLQEDAKKEDYIDLTALSTFDDSSIRNAILEAKDNVYKTKLDEFKKYIDLTHQKEIDEIKQLNKLEILKLENIISKQNEDKETSLILKSDEIEKKYLLQISTLSNEINKLKSDLIILNDQKSQLIKSNETNLELQLAKASVSFNESLKKLESELILKDESIKVKVLEVESKLRESFNEVIKEKDDEINKLIFNKSNLGVKQLGENLEIWCDNEVKSYMQNGFSNCTWSKDNEVITNDGESRGSKADYIFKIFDSSLFGTELASICIEMKDENPNSVNKKKNESYYKTLDKNREKKHCRYALLVSNLESDKVNDIPIYKVNEYSDMYVVRPQYMMTFLNLITSLTNKFKDLQLSINKQTNDLKDVTEIMEMFDSLKNTYLDKPLDSLKKDLEVIVSQSNTIKTAARKIDDTVDKITNTYIRNISDKLDKFNLKKIVKKIDNL